MHTTDRAEELIRRMLELEGRGVPYWEFMASLQYDDLLTLANELQRRLRAGEELSTRGAAAGEFKQRLTKWLAEDDFTDHKQVRNLPAV
jgi:hypothetical protein